MKRFLIISTLLSVFLTGPVYAAIHWVSPTGTQPNTAEGWAACVSATDPGSGYCTLATVTSRAATADTIYFKGSTYAITAGSSTAILLGAAQSGTGVSDRIILQNAPTETPEFVCSGDCNTSASYALWLEGASWIKVDGLKFTGFSRSGYIRNSSHHVEIANSTFQNGGGFQMISSCPGGSEYTCYVSHIWVHHNTFANLAVGACSGGSYTEGGDALRVGNPFECGATKGTSTTSIAIGAGTKVFTTQADVAEFVVGKWVRAGTGYSYTWMEGPITDYTGTSLTIEVPFGGQLDIHGSGTYASWTLSMCSTGDNKNITIEDNTLYGAGHTLFDSYGTDIVFARNVMHNEPWYTDPACGTPGRTATYSTSTIPGGADSYATTYNGKYGHRVMQVSDDHLKSASRILLEGNRLGHGSTNPNNDGADCLDLAAPGNIVRYNYLYGCMNVGLTFKYADGVFIGSSGTGGKNNRVYNNTIVNNGYGSDPANGYWQRAGFWIYTSYPNSVCEASQSPVPCCTGLDTGTCDTTDFGNVVKNNLLYGNYANTTSDYTGRSTFTNNWCNTSSPSFGCSTGGDPQFTTLDLSQPSSASLPNLTPQNASTRDGGIALTTANGAGNNTTTLIAVDATYFQDGTWGASMAQGVTLFPDQIAIGTVTNTVTISSINYATNTITLASPMTWSDGASVWLYKKSDGTRVLYGTAPDYGAYEYTGAAVAPCPAGSTCAMWLH